jgi:hypothetical protein
MLPVGTSYFSILRVAKTTKLQKQHCTSALDESARHKKKPRAGYALGVLRVVASTLCSPGGIGVSGDGDAVRIEPN